MEIEKIISQAKKEIKEESFRKKVDAMKEKMKQEKWYHKLIPFTIQRRNHGLKGN